MGQAGRGAWCLPRSDSTPHGSLCPLTQPEWSPRSPVGEAERRQEWACKAVFSQSFFSAQPIALESCFPRGSPLPLQSRALWPLRVLSPGAQHCTASFAVQQQRGCLTYLTCRGHLGSVAKTSSLRDKLVLKSNNFPRAPRIRTNYQAKTMTCWLGNFSL